MPRVYISSTYEDLKDHRKAAAAAVRAFGCETVAMEDYVAQDRRPLGKCLEDVGKSDIYILILGKRYGFRPDEQPDGARKSITQLEYEAAEKKTRLVFFLEDGVSWDTAYTDSGEDATALAAFRHAALDRHLGKAFRSPDHLEAKVSQALGNLGLTPAEVPELLPYLSDRSDQTDQLAVALAERSRDAPRRPLVVLVHGNEREAHSMFVKRLRKKILPRLLKLRGDDPMPKKWTIEWSDSKGDLTKRIGRLHSRMMDTVADQPGVMDLQALRGAVARLQGPAMITTSIFSAYWDKYEAELIEEWLKWWGSWPDLPSRHLLVVVLSVHYRHLDGGFMSALKNRADRERNRRAEEAIAGLDLSGIPGIAGVRLDRLEGLTEEHIKHWFETYVNEYCRDAPASVPSASMLQAKLMPAVRGLFQDRDHIDEEGRIAMETIAEELRTLLQQEILQGGS